MYLRAELVRTINRIVTAFHFINGRKQRKAVLMPLAVKATHGGNV